MAKVSIGLDIGASAIKVAQINQYGDRYVLTRVGMISLPLGAIEGGEVKDVNSVSQAILRLLQNNNITRKQVLAAVSGQTVIVRSLTFPMMTRKELAEAVGYEAERYIPFPTAEAVTDFDLVSDPLAKDEQEVMLVAAQRNIIDSHLAVFKRAKLQPLVIDVQPFAMARALSGYLYHPSGGIASNVAMVDVGAGTTDLVIFRGETFRFHRIIPIGGDYFSRAIAGRLSINDEAAETMKITMGYVPIGDERKTESSEDAQMTAAITGVMGELVTEIRRSLDYFRLQFHEEISKLVMAGGGTKLRNMVTFLERELGTKIEVGDPLALLDPSSRNCSPEITSNASVIFAVAIGLALRGVQE